MDNNTGSLSKTEQNYLRRLRKFIFVAILSITLFGCLMIYEASSIYAFKTTSDPAYFFKRQIFFAAVSLVFFLLALMVDLGFLRQYNKEFLLLTVIALVAVIFFGRKVGGAKRWLYISGINIQPSEILKITFLIYCADYCQRKKHFIKNITVGLMPLGFILFFIALLLLLQPDLGTAAFWFLWSLIFLFIFKAQKRHIISVILLGLVFSSFLVYKYPYRLRRITAYANPYADPQDAGFQLIQSQISYGAGGMWGVGLGESKQKLFFLPAAHTDFIFSIIAEEFGLIGTLGLISIFFLIFHKMFKIAIASEDEFKKGILWGVILILFLEVIINIGVSCGLFPTKGLPLPFVSYGGSNLVVHYVLLGLFFNASRFSRIRQP